MKTALVMPIYCPSDAVLPFLSLFKKDDFDLFVVIDDGSGEQYRHIYDEIEKKEGFVVLRHEKNKGKGDALKTAYRFLKEKHSEIEGCVTADGDGQHTYKDILRVRDALNENPDSYILGYRDFTAPNVPKRSKEGNDFSNWYFSYRTKSAVKDTQTGLRGVPSSLFGLALKTAGSKYEYEMNQLINFVQVAPIVEIEIETVYLNNNESSHFRPFRDTCRIYNGPILYILCSIVAVLLEEIAFGVLFTHPFLNAIWHPLFSVSIPHLVQGLSMFVGCYFIFCRTPKIPWSKIWRGALVILSTIAVQFAFVYCMSVTTLPIWSIILIKVVVDIFLAALDFYANMMWVFSTRKK